MKLSYLLGFVFLLALFSCKGSKKSSAVESSEEKQVKFVQTNSSVPLSLGIKKSQCFGRCPVFEFTVDDTGMMEYKGKLNIDKKGLWKGQMTKEAKEELWSLCSRTPLHEYDRFYNSGAMDTPKHQLIIGRKDSLQIISGDFSLPKPISAIIAYLDSLSNNLTMQLYEAHVPRDIISGETIVEINSEGTPEKICKDFEEYGLSFKKRISPALSLYVLTFDEEKIKPGRMLVLLKEHSMVKEAQFNHKVEQRNNR